MKKYILICLTTVFFFTLRAQQTEHVVVAVIDGVRYTETFGDSTHANISRIWSQLRSLGTIYTAFTNESLTSTVPGHSSIITGTWQKLTNNGTQRPTQPTIFEYFRKQHSVGSTACWVVSGKSKLNILSGSNHPEYGRNYSASVIASDEKYNDSYALDNTRYVLQKYHSCLTVVNFPMTDNKAHGGDWAGYLSAIQAADTLVTSLWNIIQEDSLLHNKTTLIITNDHGRHTGDFTSHGDGCKGCRHIMLLIIGPDTPAGVVDSMPHVQIDIAPTIGALMKFSTPYSTGSIIRSAIVTGSKGCSTRMSQE